MRYWYLIFFSLQELRPERMARVLNVGLSSAAVSLPPSVEVWPYLSVSLSLVKYFTFL
jgi:hypothetical protein